MANIMGAGGGSLRAKKPKRIMKAPAKPKISRGSAVRTNAGSAHALWQGVNPAGMGKNREGRGLTMPGRSYGASRPKAVKGMNPIARSASAYGKARSAQARGMGGSSARAVPSNFRGPQLKPANIRLPDIASHWDAGVRGIGDTLRRSNPVDYLFDRIGTRIKYPRR
jgi:hypothetical protein